MTVEYISIEDLSHDPKLAEALGNMIIIWSHAEIMLFSTYARITGVGLNMAMISYSRLPTFETRSKFLDSLLLEWSTSKYDKGAIKKEIGKLAKLAATRNQWVHSDWCANQDKTQTVIFNQRLPSTSDKRKKAVKAADVIQHNKTVKSRADEIGRLVDYESLDA